MNVKDATNCLLELNIRGSALGEATTNMNNMSASGTSNGDGMMDFAVFLQHYAFICDLDSNATDSEELDVASSPLLWVPSPMMGKWSEIGADTIVDLYREAIRYGVSSSDMNGTAVFEAMANHAVLESIDVNLTVKREDIGDICLGCGVHQSALVIGETMRKLQVYLDHDDTVNFQELLMIFVAIRDDPSAPPSTLGGTGGVDSGAKRGSSTLVTPRDRSDRPFSKPARPQHGTPGGLDGTLADPFSQGIDESVTDGTRMDSPARTRDGIISMSDLSHNDPRTASGSVNTGWRLPFRKHALQLTEDRIATEFRRLDLQGEGRLRYLNLKAALEAREVDENDSTIRTWLKESDRGGKGYVDYSDYKAIYDGAHEGLNPIGVGVTSDALRYGTLDPSNLNTRSSALSRQANSSRTSVSEAGRQAILEKRQLLKRAFAKYDW